MKDLLPLIIALTVIAGVAAAGLALVFQVTEEPIRQADLQKMRDAITAVLPEYTNSPDEDANWVESGDYRFFVGMDDSGAPVGIAFIVASKEGYGGTLETMVGVSPEGVINSIQILKHAETPGLGTKVTEPPFKGQFDGASMDNRTLFVAKDNKGSADKPAIDAVTGATISSRAVTDSVRTGLEYYLAHKEEILSGAGKVEPEAEEAEEVEEQ